MIKLENDQILIDGTPQLLLTGEIHYFRLDKSQWEDRIIKLKEAGCNTVASYIPWICHEMEENQFDFGNNVDRLDLEYFIKLCQKHELYFIPRPGPFIMAEMKNEGIPYWIYKKHPEAIPYGWDMKKATTATLDYLNPGFLKDAKRWYEHLAIILRPYLYENGGNIIALQLDNEIGMLSWVSNTPELTDNVCMLFCDWLEEKYGESFKTIYGSQLTDYKNDFNLFRSPEENYAGFLHEDLGLFIRDYYARYINELKQYAKAFGLINIPYIINVHGTGGGRGLTYPIGISQLYKGYTQDSDYFPGSDIYYGNLTMENFHDIYLGNAFMKAVNLPGQPIGSMEFNCGDGNFGDNYGGRLETSAADLKLRLCIAQGNRLINHYLFAGGYNYEMTPTVKDGNNRIAFTGQRHGFAAPISPEGDYNYTFKRMEESIQTCRGNAQFLADAKETFDLTYAFMPNYYMTEFFYPKSELQRKMVEDMSRFRNGSGWDVCLRSLLLANYSINSINILDHEINILATPNLVVTLGQYLNENIQEKLVSYLKDGGNLLIYGTLPLYNEKGQECHILIDYLEVTDIEHLYEKPDYYLSVCPVNEWKDNPEARTTHVQTYTVPDCEIFMVEKETKKACGFYKMLEKGKVIALTSDYRGDRAFFTDLLAKFNCQPTFTHDFKEHGIFMTTTRNVSGEMMHLINLDDYKKNFNIYKNGQMIIPNVTLEGKRGLMLPYQLAVKGGKILSTNCEIIKDDENSLTLRGSHHKKWLKLDSPKEISSDYLVEKTGQKYLFEVDDCPLEVKINF